MAENEGKIDDLMLGNVSEEISETDEQIAARVQAAQAKLAQLKKDEGQSKVYDQKLAGIISQLDPRVLDVVVFLIDADISSLTILAVISLVNAEAEKVCKKEFEQVIEERADFSSLGIENEEIRHHIEHWWTYIIATDHVSKSTRMSEFSKNEKFRTPFAQHMFFLLRTYIKKAGNGEIEEDILVRINTQYEEMLYAPKS